MKDSTKQFSNRLAWPDESQVHVAFVGPVSDNGLVHSVPEIEMLYMKEVSHAEPI